MTESVVEDIEIFIRQRSQQVELDGFYNMANFKQVFRSEGIFGFGNKRTKASRSFETSLVCRFLSMNNQLHTQCYQMTINILWFDAAEKFSWSYVESQSMKILQNQ